MCFYRPSHDRNAMNAQINAINDVHIVEMMTSIELHRNAQKCIHWINDLIHIMQLKIVLEIIGYDIPFYIRRKA